MVSRAPLGTSPPTIPTDSWRVSALGSRWKGRHEGGHSAEPLRRGKQKLCQLSQAVELSSQRSAPVTSISSGSRAGTLRSVLAALVLSPRPNLPHRRTTAPRGLVHNHPSGDP